MSERASLSGSGQQNNLQSVALDGETLKGADFQDLANRRDVTSLNLNNNLSIDNQAIKSIAAIPNLKELIITGSTASAHDWSPLSKTSIESLVWSNDIYKDVADTNVSVIAQMKSLKTLDMQNCGITDAGLAKLAENKNIETLDLETAQNLTPASIDTFAKMSGLKKLDLREAAHFNQSDAVRLAEVLKKALPNCEVIAGPINPNEAAANLRPAERSTVDDLSYALNGLTRLQNEHRDRDANDALNILSHLTKDERNRVIADLEYESKGYKTTATRDANGDVKSVSITKDFELSQNPGLEKLTPGAILSWLYFAGANLSLDAGDYGARKSMRGDKPDIELQFKDDKVTLLANDFYSLGDGIDYPRWNRHNKAEAPYLPTSSSD